MSQIKYLDTAGTQTLINEIKSRLSTKITRYATMPSATVNDVGDIVQYIGTTNSNFTKGDFYLGSTGASVEVSTYVVSSNGITGALEVVAADADPFDEETQIKVDTAKLVSDLPEVQVGDYVKLTTTTVPTYNWVQVSYSKDEINELIGRAGHFAAVNSLPTTDIATNIIYLVPKKKTVSGYTATDGSFYVPSGNTYIHYDASGAVITGTVDDEAVAAAIEDETYTAGTKEVLNPQDNNTKDEYINIDGTVNGWEKIGETLMDLSNYIQFDDLVAITSNELDAMWDV